MNINKPVVCIFPHSKKDPDTKSTDALIQFLNVTLPGRQGRYHLIGIRRNRKFEGESFIEAVCKGSLVLFKMKGKVWGAGFIHGIEAVPGNDKFKFTVDFYPETLVSYKKGIAIQDIERVTGCEGTYYRVLGYSDMIEHKLRRIMDLPIRPV